MFSPQRPAFAEAIAGVERRKRRLRRALNLKNYFPSSRLPGYIHYYHNLPFKKVNREGSKEKINWSPVLPFLLFQVFWPPVSA